VFDNLRADLARYVSGDEPTWRKLVVYAETQAVWATAVYRYGRWVYTEAPPRLRTPLKAVYRVAQKVAEIATGMQIPASCEIGPGLGLGHFGTLIIHGQVKMGRDCSIGHDTTIGTRGDGLERGVPVIGDGVYLGSGCRVLGPIRVGDGAAVGANAVVLCDVPAGAKAVGVPARIIPARAHAPAAGPAAGLDLLGSTALPSPPIEPPAGRTVWAEPTPAREAMQLRGTVTR
jgi:serine O-acetyltransferase